MTIAVGGTGFVAVERVAVIHAREMTRESFEPLAILARTPPPGRVARAESPELAQETPAMYASPKAPTIVGAPSNEGTFNARSSVKWISWGAATAAIAIGALAYTRQTSAGSQFNAGCYFDQSGTIRPIDGAPTSSDACKGLNGRVDTWYGTEVGALLGAAALAAIGVVFWLTEPSEPSASAAALSCAPEAAGGRSVSWGCRWRF